MLLVRSTIGSRPATSSLDSTARSDTAASGLPGSCPGVIPGNFSRHTEKGRTFTIRRASDSPLSHPPGGCVTLTLEGVPTAPPELQAAARRFEAVWPQWYVRYSVER